MIFWAKLIVIIACFAKNKPKILIRIS